MASLLLAVIYVAFISLGLPDSLLGSAWPTMSQDLNVPVAWAGGISAVISMFTIVSALLSDRMTLKFGAGKVTAVSVALTAAALAGFSVTSNYWVLLAIAIPYGLGAGGVDAALNNYVAIHYESRHMSWLHCMWGVGTIVGPQVMGAALAGGAAWQSGYLWVAVIQSVIAAVMIFSLPLWKINRHPGVSEDEGRPLSIRQAVSLPGAKCVLLIFCFYCAVEHSALLWGSSYLAGHAGMSADRAASLGALFCIGITAGRALSGFLTMKLSDDNMIRLGLSVMLTASVVMLLPLGEAGAICGLLLFGAGCAPVYPCTIHATPRRFGAENSQALIGIQMACAYVGTCLAPPLFGLIARFAGVRWLPVYLILPTVAMLLLLRRIRGLKRAVDQ